MIHGQLINAMKRYSGTDNEKTQGVEAVLSLIKATAPEVVRKRIQEFPPALVAACRDRFGENYVEKLMNDDYSSSPMRSFIEGFIHEQEPVAFYFDEEFNKELGATATEFAKGGLIIPPFPSIIIHSTGMLKNFKVHSTKAGIDLIQDLTVWLQHFPPSNTLGAMFVSAEKFKSEGTFTIHFIMKLYLSSGTYDIIDVSKEGWPVHSEAGKYEQAGALLAQSVLQCLMLLNHPAYEQEKTEIAKSVNDKRERKGKTRLHNYIYVRMKKEIRDRIAAGEGGFRAPHWRRGHLRRLGDGRVVPVQACLVNWEDGDSVPDKKIYVQKGGNNG